MLANRLPNSPVAQLSSPTKRVEAPPLTSKKSSSGTDESTKGTSQPASSSASAPAPSTTSSANLSKPPNAQLMIDQLKKGVMELQLMEQELKQIQKETILAKQANPSLDISQNQQRYREKFSNIDKLRVSLNVQKDLLTKYGMLPPARPASKPTGAQGVSSNNSTPNRPATNVCCFRSFICLEILTLVIAGKQ